MGDQRKRQKITVPEGQWGGGGRNVPEKKVRSLETLSLHSQASAFISLFFLSAEAEAATLTPRMCGENKKDGVEEKWGERQGTKSGKKRISQILFKNFF